MVCRSRFNHLVAQTCECVKRGGGLPEPLIEYTNDGLFTFAEAITAAEQEQREQVGWIYTYPGKDKKIPPVLSAHRLDNKHEWVERPIYAGEPTPNYISTSKMRSNSA